MVENIENQAYQNFFGQLSFFILIGITVLFIPFWGLSSTLDPVLTPRFFVWGIMLFVLSTLFVIRLYENPNSIDYSVLRRATFFAFLGYFLFSLISLTKAINITEGIYELVKIFLSIVYLFIATTILNERKNRIPILVKAVVVTATILSAIAICQYFLHAFNKPGIDVLYSVRATMAHKNQLSSALFLMLPFCLYAALAFHDYWKAVSIIPIVLILLNIFLLQTRSVWVGLFVSTISTIIVFGFLFRRFNIFKEMKLIFLRRSLYIVSALIIVLSISVYFHLKSDSIDSLLQRVRSIYTGERDGGRIYLWQKTLELTKDNVIFGVGAGNWKIVVPSCSVEFRPNAFLGLHYQRPHNDYIWVLSEVGIFGFICYLSIFGVTIFYIFKILIHHSNTNDKLLSIFMFFGIVGYMAISFFTFPKERIFHSAFLLLMMAIVISIYHQSLGDKKTVSPPFMFSLVIPSILLLSFAIFIGYIRLNAEVHTKRALEARRIQDWPVVISEIDKGYSAFATLDPTSAPLQWYKGEANFLLNNTQKALEDYEKAYKAHPYHIYVLNNLATCYELTGDHNQAIYYYRKALSIFPRFERALINLGATYYNVGKYDDAYKTLLRCNPKTKKPELGQYLKIVREKMESEEN